MATQQMVIDPVVEDASNVPLDLLVAPYSVSRFSTPTPPIDPRWAEPTDADGERLSALRYRNRTVTLTVQIGPFTGATASASGQAALAVLADKVAKVNRRGGTLRRVMASGRVVTFDLITADPIDPSWDIAWETAATVSVDLSFNARPFGRGDEVAYTAHTEATNPVLVFTETGPAGDVPALGRLALTDAQAADQSWAVWGVQSAHYDSAATAALYYAASGRTAYSGTLTTDSYKALLSTQATGGGAHLTHVGLYRVFARVQRGTGTGDFTLALDWAVGDFLSYTRNDAVTYPVGDPSTALRIFDLGIVALPTVTKGAQRWEGRVVARSTVAGDTAPTPSSLWLVPVDEGSGEITANAQTSAVTAYSAQDGFDQAAGALTGKTLPTGGTWTGAGSSATDFAVTGLSAISRTATGDAATNLSSGRIVTASSPTTLTSTHVEVQVGVLGAVGELFGLVARYQSASAFLAAYITVLSSASATLSIAKRVAGVDTVISSVPISGVPYLASFYINVKLSIDVTSGGVVAARAVGANGLSSSVDVSISGYDSVLATSGTLAAGTVGIFDRNTGTGTNGRGFDSFLAYPLVYDAAFYASQSAEIRHDGAIRQDSAGTVWAPSSIYEGDRLTIPPAGPEGRTVRVIAKASRTIPGTGPDPSVDDLTGQLFATPRYLVVPA